VGALFLLQHVDQCMRHEDVCVLKNVRAAALLAHIVQYVAGVLRRRRAGVLAVQVVVLLHVPRVQHVCDGVGVGVDA